MSSPSAPQPAPVMFTCETKGVSVTTGHYMRPAEFEGLVGSRAFRCAACNEVHTWTAETAWLRIRTIAA